MVPILAIFLASYSSIWLASGPNLISKFSPVKEALLTFKSEDCMILRSAGTFSPPTTLTMSPGTSVVASTVLIIPSLTTETVEG